MTVIPCRESRRNRGYSTHGIYRNQMKKALKEEGELRKIYNQRPQVETTNFMIKTHTGSHVLSRLDRTKVVQTLCKVIAHNCKIVSERGWSWGQSSRFHQGYPQVHGGIPRQGTEGMHLPGASRRRGARRREHAEEVARRPGGVRQRPAGAREHRHHRQILRPDPREVGDRRRPRIMGNVFGNIF